MAGSVRIPIVSSFDPKGIDGAVSALQGFRDQFNAATDGFQKVGVLGDAFVAVGASLTRNVTLPLVAAGAAAYKEFANQEEALARLRAILKATGQQAGVTEESVMAFASSLQQTTVFADDAVMSAAALLLTFKNVRNEVGYNADIFDRTLVVAADLSTLLGTDLQGAVLQLGKALEDPVTGLTALRRAGVSFSESQRETIANLVESGDLLTAQQIILREVESQFGGTAAAMAETSRGQMKQAFNELGDSVEGLGSMLVPMLQEVSNLIRQIADGFNSLSPAMQSTVVQVGALAAVLGPLLLIFGKLLQALRALGPLVAFIKGALVALAAALGVSLGVVAAVIVAVIAYVVAMIAWFRYLIQNWDEVRAKAVELANTIQESIQRAYDYVASKVGEFGEIGKNIIRAMVSGVKSAAKSLADAAVAAVQAAIAAAKAALGIKSPSKVFLEIGRNTIEGFVLGIESMEPSVLASMNSQMGFDARGAGGGGVVVNVQGAIDPEGTARTILRVLQDAERRTGARL